MRGYGDSERPDGVSAYKLNLLVDDIRDLVRQLGNIKNGLENCPDEIMADKVMLILSNFFENVGVVSDITIVRGGYVR